jgi:hypothetical protein
MSPVSAPRAKIHEVERGPIEGPKERAVTDTPSKGENECKHTQLTDPSKNQRVMVLTDACLGCAIDRE